MQPYSFKTGLPGKLKRWSVFLAIFTIAIAFLVLIGWQFDISFFKRPLPGSKVMNPVAAVMFILASTSFLFLTTGQNTTRKLKVGYLLALLVLLIGTAKFVSIVFGLDLKIDTLLFQTEPEPDRIVPIAAVNFILTGIALLLLHTKSKRKRITVDIILLLLAGISLFSILGYLYRVKIFYGLFTYLPMAIHAAACFLFLSLSILFFNPGKGMMKEITGPYAGSLVARRLIPAAILAPAVLGLLRMIGHWTNSFTPEFGVSILVFTIIVVLMVIIWYSVTLLNKRDRQSKLAEAALKESDEQIQTIFNAAPDAVIVMDQHGHIARWNPKAESVFGWTSDEVMGKPLNEIIIPHRYREAHKKGLEHFLKTGEGPVLGKTIEIQAISKNNSEFDVALSISPTIINDQYLFIGFIRDITERKKAEEKLLLINKELESSVRRIKESEENHSILLNSIDEGFCIIEMIFDEQKKPIDYRFLVINASFERQTGLRNAVGKRMREFAPKHEEYWFETYGRIALTGESIRFENRAEQLHRWYDVYAFRFGEPKNLQVAILFNDITERKKTEETIQQMNLDLEKRVEEKTREIIQGEKKFRNLIENSTDIISLTDENFNPVYRSSSAARITGWTNEEWEKLTATEQIHPDDLAGIISKMKEILANPGKPFPISARMRHKQGHYIWLEGTMTNMLYDESIKAIVANMRDITERKRAEEALLESQQMLSAIINNSAAVIYVKDLQGRYLLLNRRFLELFHLSEEDILGKTDYDIFSKKEADAFRQMDVRTAAANHALIEEEKAPQDDGIHTYISVKSALRNASGEPYGIFGISTDITDLKKAQLEVEKLNVELEQKVIDRTAELQSSNKELESFTYSVSHDLRAPLRIIHGYTDIFVTDYKNKLDEEANRLLDIIKSNAMRMGQLIDDLLNLSKTGRKALLIHYTDMNQLVRSVIDEQLLLTGNIATVKVKNLEPAECDRSLMRQVWSNFISNAIKYSRETEKPVIEINSNKTAHEIVYSIKDNGVGFDMNYADKLFGVFQRLHSMEEFEGTGVGLALVQRIVNKHGGRVWAEAEVGKGATFYFSLPVIQTN